MTWVLVGFSRSVNMLQLLAGAEPRDLGLGREPSHMTWVVVGFSRSLNMPQLLARAEPHDVGLGRVQPPCQHVSVAGRSRAT